MGARFTDEVVLVTGGAGQIGSECVRAFAREGAYVVAVDAAPAPIALGDGERVLVLREDLTSEDGIARIFAAAEERFGTPGVVVQCAAAHGRMPYLELTAENVDAVHAINVRAPLLIGRTAANAMIAAGIRGAIVNFTSISGVVSHAESVAYEASKGAVTMATRGMAVALAPHGIRVNAVGPGVMVKLQELAPVRAPTDVDDYERRRIPLGRYGTAAEIAEVAMFLASPAASYVTGEVLYADGGALAAWASAETTPAAKEKP
jgi:NAD(P)-dependent dehydrogenase (short-subunit alcohol dehydrogenase family)